MNTILRQTIRVFVFATLAMTYFGLASKGHTATATPTGAANSSQIAATVNNAPIYRTQLEEAVKATGLADSTDLRQAILEQLIARELIRQAAQREAIDKKPEVRQLIEQMRATIEIEAYLQTKLQTPDIPEQDVRNRYNALLAMTGQDEFKAKLVTSKSAQDAEAIYRRLNNGETFDAIANELRGRQPQALNGELPWVSFKLPLEEGKTNGWPLPLAQAISQLKVGEVTSPLQVEDDYYIVKLEQKRPVQIPAFDTIRPELQRQLEVQKYQQALQAHVEQLRKQATIRR